LTVSVEVTAAVPVIEAGWLTEQVGASTVPAGPAPIVHPTATPPVNPPLGVIVTVDVVEAPGATAVADEAANENDPTGAVSEIT
jgi:hypothetical protein